MDFKGGGNGLDCFPLLLGEVGRFSLRDVLGVNVFLAWCIVFVLGSGHFFVCFFGSLFEHDMASVGVHKSAIVGLVGMISDGFGGWDSWLAKESDLLGGFLGFGLGVLGCAG